MCDVTVCYPWGPICALMCVCIPHLLFVMCDVSYNTVTVVALWSGSSPHFAIVWPLKIALDVIKRNFCLKHAVEMLSQPSGVFYFFIIFLYNIPYSAFTLRLRWHSVKVLRYLQIDSPGLKYHTFTFKLWFRSCNNVPCSNSTEQTIFIDEYSHSFGFCIA